MALRPHAGQSPFYICDHHQTEQAFRLGQINRLGPVWRKRPIKMAISVPVAAINSRSAVAGAFSSLMLLVGLSPSGQITKRKEDRYAQHKGRLTHGFDLVDGLRLGFLTVIKADTIT